MGIADIVLGITALSAVGAASFAYGFTDARGTALPGKEYALAAGVGANLYAGSRFKFGDGDTRIGNGLSLTVLAAAAGSFGYIGGLILGRVVP